MKKIVILQNNGGRLANQLWNYASVYSYALEKKIPCENYSWFLYQRYFAMELPSSAFVGWLFFMTPLFGRGRLKRTLYNAFVSLFTKIKPGRVLSDEGVEFALPPSTMDESHKSLLEQYETKYSTGYLSGWMFRNPEGLKKYHGEIKTFFKPRAQYTEPADELIHTLREKYATVVGVHIRQGDYRTWQNGAYYFSPADAKKIMDAFIADNQLTPDAVAFVVCSDEKIDPAIFAGMNVVYGPGNEVSDWYALSLCDLVIGSNSTYGTWAAYYGSIPFVEFKRGAMVWPQNIKKS